jgi:DNA-binding GntR family transcriptional regulator
VNNLKKLLEEGKGTRRKVNVYKTLKNAIQFLELEPGSSITDAQLASELGVSRTPVREALIRLSDDLLVDIYPQKGTYVSKINLSIVKEIEYMRHIIETKICLKMCAKKADIRHVVDESLFLMDIAVKKRDIVRFVLSDDAFHRALFSYAKHEMIWNIISNNRMHYNRFLMLDMAFPNVLEESYEDHKKIVKYIHCGDSEKLIQLFDRHHDHKYMAREEEIIKQFGEYIV